MPSNTINEQASGLTTSQRAEIEKTLKIAKDMTHEVEKQGKATQGLVIGYREVSEQVKDFVAKLVKSQKSEEEINKLLGIRLQKEYELGDIQKKNEMVLDGLRTKRLEAEEKYQNALLEFSQKQLELQGKTDADSKNKLYQAERTLKTVQQNYQFQMEKEKAFADLKNMSLDSYEKKRINYEKAEEHRQKAADKSLQAMQAKRKLQETNDAKERKEYQEEYNQLVKEANEELIEAQNQEHGGRLSRMIGVDIHDRESVGKALEKSLSEISKKLDNVVENAINVVSQMQTSLNYRLESIGKTFDDVYKMTRNNLMLSAAVKQQAVLEKIGKAVDQGIAYNVEQRAFLSEVSEKIQGTFDAFDSNLLRLIRIQSADSTAARLGMEKALNDMLTTYYKDSSYLNDLYDSVSQSLFEMTSTQGREQSLQTEYVIQKWLGGLYSVGASQNAIQQIATGLGYLGSGNVEALASNQGLQTLLALSASRAGLDYAQMLTEGLDASNANKLMEAMVYYLSQIAEDTSENRVVTSAYGNIFGLSLSDIKSFANLRLTAGELAGETLGYGQAYGQTLSSLGNLGRYTGAADYIKTLSENAMFNVGMTYSKGLPYLLYKAVDVVGDLTGGLRTELAPFGTGTSFSLTDMAKAGMFGVGLIAQLLGGGLGSIGADQSLSGWGAEEYNRYGTGFSLRTTSGTSTGTTIGSSSTKDIEEQSLKEGMEKSQDIQSATGADEENIFKALVRKGDQELVSNIKLKIDSIDERLLRSYNLLDEITSSSSKRTVNVNLQKISGKDADGAITTRPSQDWGDLVLKAAYLIAFKEALSGFGGQFVQNRINADDGEEKRTLQEMLNLIVPMLESDDGIPVRLESTDSMTNLMQDLSRR